MSQDIQTLKESMAKAAAADERVRQARHKAPPAAEPNPSENPTTAVSSSNIQVPVELPLPRQAELVFQALGTIPSPGLVQHGSGLSRVVRRAGRLLLESHTRESLRGHVARNVRFVKTDSQGNKRDTNPSLGLMDDLLSLPAYPDCIPVVRSIKSSPLLTEHGNLITTSGLYPQYQVYLDLDPVLEGMTIPDTVTDDDLAAAVETLLDPFRDFPVEPDSVGNLFGLLFTMVLRELIDGVTPLFIVDANRPGAGKGLLVSAASMIAYGRDADFSPANVASDELRKRLLAVFRQGVPLHVLDNIEQVIWSPELSAMLTSMHYADRLLRVNEMPAYQNNLILIGTGNNVRLGGDIPRRTVLIRLESPCARPEERGDFTYPQLLPYLRTSRRDILQAVYTIASVWMRAGRPMPEETPAMGSFQPWANFAAGLLGVVGATGLLENRNQLRARDLDEEEYETMLYRARAHFGNGEFTARQLCGALDPDDLPTALGNSPQVNLAKRMGRLLTRIEGRILGTEQLRVRHLRTVDKTKYYGVECLGEDRS